jgi:endonuclease/exonuclease/phosphatase family metal-dependent hydrolase
MPTITDQPPEQVRTELHALSAELDEHIPAKMLDRNLLIGTWNIRAFGGLTRKWNAGDDDSPKRDLWSLRAIGEIIGRFDVVALQEVRGNLRALRDLLKYLNRRDQHWGVILTDVTRGDPGNDERMAFLFDTRRLRPSGLACELVLPDPDEWSDIDPDDLTEGAFQRQFARTPYAVSFVASGMTFILVTLHVIYGKNAAEREPELRAIATWLSEWAQQVNSWDHNLIALGDFNIDRIGDPLYDAFTSTGLRTPLELDNIPRTIFGSMDKQKHYDQVAWFTGEQGVPALSLDYTGQAGNFDFVPHVRKDLTKQEKSWRVSDHYPLWVEFAVPEGDSDTA